MDEGRALRGRTVVVTGASSGIGWETARALAAMGARTVLLVRDKGRGEAAADRIRAGVPGARLEIVLGDLYSLAEVRRLGAEIRERFDALHVLVNNAGLIHATRELTTDGIERTFALNHLATFLLTYELRELLVRSAPARVVTVSSAAHRLGRLDWDTLTTCEKGYNETTVYSTSKLCNVLFAREAARHFAGTGVTSNSLHPGAVASNFGASGSILYRLGTKIVRPFLLTAAQGARTSIHVASSPEVEGVTGEYFVRRKVARPSAAARSDENAARLWRLSEELSRVEWR
jgi:retinol dehydrogenase 12